MSKPAGKRPAAPLGASLVVLSSFFYASYGIWSTLMGGYFDTYAQATLRCLLVALLLIVFALVRKQLQKLNWRRDWWLFALSLLSSTLIAGPMYYAIVEGGVGIGVAIGYIGIVIGMFFFGWLFNKERYTKDKWLSTVLGVIGLLLVFSPSLKTIGWLALTAALISGLFAAMNMVLSKKFPYNTDQSAILTWTLAVPANLPFVFLLHESWPALAWDIHWLYLLCFVVASLIASWTVIKGMKLIEAGAAGILGLLEIVFGAVFGMILFHEQPSALVILGMAVIMLAAAVPYVQHYNARKGTLE